MVEADTSVDTETRIERGLVCERDYVKGEVNTINARIDGIDKATELLSETVTRVPTEVTGEVSHLNSLMMEKFESVQTQFTERDTRSERESRDNKVAVDAAFAAQKEAAAKQDEANQKAIDKSEAATSETITKLTELFNTTISGIRGTVDDLKLQVANLNSILVNGQINRTDSRAVTANTIAIVGVIVAAILVGSALIGFHK